VIGKPKLLPLWANGFHLRSQQYINQTILEETLDHLKSINVHIESVSLPLDALRLYTNFDYLIDLKEVQQKHPTTRMILPFTYIVTNSSLGHSDLNYLLTYNKVVTT